MTLYQKVPIFLKIFLFLLVFSVGFIPLFLNAQTPLVPCDNSPSQPCDFNAFVSGIQRVINWFITIAAMLSAIAFAYAGFLLLTGGGNPGKREKAKEIFTKVLIGFIIVLSSWLIVHAVLVGLGADPTNFFLSGS